MANMTKTFIKVFITVSNGIEKGKEVNCIYCDLFKNKECEASQNDLTQGKCEEIELLKRYINKPLQIEEIEVR